MRQASGLEERGHLYETLPLEQREELLQCLLTAAPRGGEAMIKGLEAEKLITLSRFSRPTNMGAVFTGPQWAAGLAQDAKTKDRRLIPVRVRPVNVSGLLGAFVYIDLVDKDEPAAREALLSGITSGRAKPHQVAFPGAGSSQSPAFPGEQPAGGQGLP